MLFFLGAVAAELVDEFLAHVIHEELWVYLPQNSLFGAQLHAIDEFFDLEQQDMASGVVFLLVA